MPITQLDRQGLDHTAQAVWDFVNRCFDIVYAQKFLYFRILHSQDACTQRFSSQTHRNTGWVTDIQIAIWGVKDSLNRWFSCSSLNCSALVISHTHLEIKINHYVEHTSGWALNLETISAMFKSDRRPNTWLNIAQHLAYLWECCYCCRELWSGFYPVSLPARAYPRSAW